MRLANVHAMLQLGTATWCTCANNVWKWHSLWSVSMRYAAAAAIAIVVFTTALCVYFKWFLRRKLRVWANQEDNRWRWAEKRRRRDLCMCAHERKYTFLLNADSDTVTRISCGQHEQWHTENGQKIHTVCVFECWWHISLPHNHIVFDPEQLHIHTNTPATISLCIFRQILASALCVVSLRTVLYCTQLKSLVCYRLLSLAHTHFTKYIS